MATDLTPQQQREIGIRNRERAEDHQREMAHQAQQALLSNPDDAALGALIRNAAENSNTGALHILLSERERRRLGTPKNWVSYEGRKPQRTASRNGYIESPPPVTEQELRPAPEPTGPPTAQPRVYSSKDEMDRALLLERLLRDSQTGEQHEH